MLNAWTPNSVETRSVIFEFFSRARSICHEFNARMIPFGAVPNRLIRPQELTQIGLLLLSKPVITPVGSSGGGAKAAGLIGRVWFGCSPPGSVTGTPGTRSGLWVVWSLPSGNWVFEI